jgi:hypothetical protein
MACRITHGLVPAIPIVPSTSEIDASVGIFRVSLADGHGVRDRAIGSGWSAFVAMYEQSLLY